mmetsp:Transcript_20320/g.35751  ORF Transcript_20320/g.35751 Transcript_20320/m.35751 type:complete len:142 (+) Transcript_20320:245-670(+)
MHLNEGTTATPERATAIVQAGISKRRSRNIVLGSEIEASHPHSDEDVKIKYVPCNNARTMPCGAQQNGYNPSDNNGYRHDHAGILVVTGHSNRIEFETLQHLTSEYSGTAPPHKEWARASFTAIAEAILEPSSDRCRGGSG